MIDALGEYDAERDRRIGRAIREEEKFGCLYCMDLRVVWEPEVMDAPIDPRLNPKREKPCPMCRERGR